MKQFDLEEYSKNPRRKVITRDGKDVRIVCTDMIGTSYPVLAICRVNPTHDCYYSYTINGKHNLGVDSRLDLFFAPEKHEGWINIFRGKDNPFTGNIIFASKEEAEESGRHFCGFIYITSGKVEWEE